MAHWINAICCGSFWSNRMDASLCHYIYVWPWKSSRLTKITIHDMSITCGLHCDYTLYTATYRSVRVVLYCLAFCSSIRYHILSATVWGRALFNAFVAWLVSPTISVTVSPFVPCLWTVLFYPGCRFLSYLEMGKGESRKTYDEDCTAVLRSHMYVTPFDKFHAGGIFTWQYLLQPFICKRTSSILCSHISKSSTM